MRKTLVTLFIILSLSACHSDEISSDDANETRTFISHDTIPDIRDSVNPEPVAAFASSKGDKLEVKVYETRETFRFIMKMQYQYLNEPDTLLIPNFGIRPKIVIQKGADGKSCIVGFLDKKDEFKEYKLVTVKTGNLQVKVLKRYYAGAYKTTYDDTTGGH